MRSGLGVYTGCPSTWSIGATGEDVGIVASDRYRTALAEQGMGSIEVPEGMEAMERILAHRVPQSPSLKLPPRFCRSLVSIMTGEKSSIRSVTGPIFEELRASHRE